ncbi:flagellar protein [Salipaludibacillus sp. CF4.18]|uniref:flagellar protein n=1 Tax=Salipaludibacillus sp. CF4.18 TaxID=3373081 RepID=UPI003EE61CC6
MSAITELHTVTKALYGHLQQTMPKDEGREEYIEVIENYLGERQPLMDKVSQPSGAEEEFANDVVKMNKEINLKMVAIQAEIRMDLNRLKMRKQTGKKYENPYDGPTSDGIFFDSKK